MKTRITEEMAHQMLGNIRGDITTVNGVDLVIVDEASFPGNGEYSTILAVPLIEVEVESEEELENLNSHDLWYWGVTIAYPRRDDFAPDPDDCFDWEAEYDGDSPEFWDIGKRLPQDLDER